MAKSIARNLADVASPTGVLDGTLSTAAQTNITSVGTLSSLNLSGALTGTTGTFTTADNLTQVRLISTDADASIGPRLDLFRNSASPAAGDFIGRVRFLAEDSTGAETAYVHFDSLIVDPTDGSEDGQLRIETKVDGSMIERITMDSTETVINNNHANLDFRIESDTKANAFFIEGTTGIVGINTNTPTSTLDVNGSTGIFVRHSTGGSLVLDDNDTADGSTPMVYMRNTAGTLKLGRANRSSGLTTGSTDSMTISATGDAHFTGNIEVGDGANISMDSSASGQLQVDGNGYYGAIALDGTAMYVYHNSSSRNLVLGTNETAALTLAGSNQEATFAHHVNLADNKYLKLGDNDDMLVYHNGSASYVQSATADLDIIFRGNDTGVGGFDALTLDMSAGGLAKFSSGARPVTDGVGTLGGTSHRWGGLNIYSTTHEGVKFTIQNTVGNTSMQGFRLDMDVSGNETLDANRAMYGQYITLDSSSTGGSTTNGTEHRLYGIRSSVRATGDSDLIYGGYFSGEAEHSAGTVSILYGSYNQASADPESGGTVGTLYGAWNTATVYGSAGSTVNHAYASYNRLLLGTTDVVAHTNLVGVMSEIETDASGTGRVTTNGFLFRGSFDDDSGGEHKFTNFYGLKVDGTSLVGRTELETDNSEARFGLPTGNTAGVYLDIPMESDYNCQGFWNSEDQPNYFRGSLGIGSGARQVGNTVGAELHLVEPDGGEAVLVRYDGTTQNGNSLGKIFWGATENSGVNVNFSASIESIASQNHSTTASGGMLTFKTTANNSTQLVEHLRIDEDGHIGVHNDNPQTFSGYSTFHISPSSGNTGSAFLIDDSNGSGGRFQVLMSNSAYIGTRSDDNLIFTSNDAERMRLTNGGLFFIGKTASSLAYTGVEIHQNGIMYATSTSTQFYLNRDSGSHGVQIQGRKQNSNVWSISSNGTNFASDRNFKKDITELQLGLDFVKELKPKTFRFKMDKETDPLMTGLIAQDLEQSLTDAGVEKNSMTLVQHEPQEDQSESQYVVDYSKLIPVLIKGMQEQQTQIEALQAEVAALKGS